MKTFIIGDKKIGLGHPMYIIAEASSNHGGKIERAKKMIDVAAKAGADAVKFQVFTAENIAADTNDPRTMLKKGKTIFAKKDTKLIDLYRKNELPRKWLPKLAAHAKKKGVTFLATPFDERAVDELGAVGVPAFKVASYEMTDVVLLRKVAKTGKPLVLSTGMADISEIAFALKTFRNAGGNKVALLHCSSTYPTPFEDVHLRAMDTMRKKFGVPVGYSDHTLGTEIPIAATTLGAAILEKHFMLDDGVDTVDAPFSLTPKEFKKMVVEIRNVERALGKAKKTPSRAEMRERKQARRSLWTVEDIRRGAKFTKQNVRILRPGLGLSPILYDKVIGQAANKTIKGGSPLKKGDIADSQKRTG